jgi:hypothetical protein
MFGEGQKNGSGSVLPLAHRWAQATYNQVEPNKYVEHFCLYGLVLQERDDYDLVWAKHQGSIESTGTASKGTYEYVGIRTTLILDAPSGEHLYTLNSIMFSNLSYFNN